MTDFDRILASSPMNVTAARQLSRGEHFEPSVQLQDFHEVMPPLAKVAPGALEDFTGLTLGRLTVIGKMAKANRNSKASWVCRCKCGYFATRRSKALKLGQRGEDGFVDRCGHCDYERKLREGWFDGRRNT